MTAEEFKKQLLELIMKFEDGKGMFVERIILWDPVLNEYGKGIRPITIKITA